MRVAAKDTGAFGAAQPSVRFFRGVALWVLAGLSPPVIAALGLYEHGAGIKSQGAGGISYSYGEESTVLSFNPALASGLDDRNDLGVSAFLPVNNVEIQGNLFGRNERYDADGQSVYPIPQGGFVRHLNARWTLGFSLFTAGLGPDFTQNPYERFGGGHRASTTLVSCGAALALSWLPHPDHAFGFSVNPGYQMIRIEGVQFLDYRLPPFRASETPGKASNQGFDGRPNISATFGWHGLVLPALAAGASYRSKSWTQRHRDYRGLLPDRGHLELPAIWGGGLAWMPHRAVTLAYDFQRYEFASQRALGNRVGNLLDGNLAGSKNGPGFGFRDLSAHKFGFFWLASERLTLRVGYIHATRPTRRSETLLDGLGSINTTTHYTAGFTWASGAWELSGFGAYAPEKVVRGEDSIPLLFGGGEANTSFAVQSYGMSIGWGFGD